jgi:hypothetical protein
MQTTRISLSETALVMKFLKAMITRHGRFSLHESSFWKQATDEQRSQLAAEVKEARRILGPKRCEALRKAKGLPQSQSDWNAEMHSRFLRAAEQEIAQFSSDDIGPMGEVLR